MAYDETFRRWRVIASEDVEDNLSAFVNYLLNVKQSEQAANAVIDDYFKTIEELENVAGALKLVDNPRLSEYGYRRINFLHHNYYFLYRIEASSK